MMKLFLKSVAWSWFVFGCASVAVEFFRPAFVDYLLPVWIIFVVAAGAGAASLITKK